MPAVDFGPIVMLNGTTGTGTGYAPGNSVVYLLFHVTGYGTTSGGTIVLEEALGLNFGGTWGTLQTISASTVTAGVDLPVHIGPGIFNAVRARFSANITGGGTVLVTLSGGPS